MADSIDRFSLGSSCAASDSVAFVAVAAAAGAGMKQKEVRIWN